MVLSQVGVNTSSRIAWFPVVPTLSPKGTTQKASLDYRLPLHQTPSQAGCLPSSAGAERQVSDDHSVLEVGHFLDSKVFSSGNTVTYYPGLLRRFSDTGACIIPVCPFIF